MNRLRWLLPLVGFWLILTTGPAAGDVIVDGSDGQADLGPPVDCNGVSAAPTSIGAGLASTSSGDTVWVCPHTYHETLVVDTPNVTIRSTGDSTNTVVRAPNSASAATLPTLLVGGDNVRVRGVRFRNGFSGVVFFGVSGGAVLDTRADSNVAHGIALLLSSRVSVEGSRFDANDTHGINVESADTNVLVGNLVRSNGFSGVVVRDGSGGNVVRDNAMDSNGLNGVLFSTFGSGSGRNRLENNRVRGNGFDGVVVTSSSDSNTLVGNRVERNGLRGLVLSGVDTNTVRGNVLDTNAASGLTITGGGDHFVGSNRLRFNGGHGVFVVSSAGNELRGNLLHSNGVDNVHMDGATNNSLGSNTLRNGAGADDNGVVLDAGSNGNNVGGNRIEEHDSAGIRVFNSNNNTFRDNRIDTNALGVWLHNAEDHFVEGNRIRDNDTGIFVTGSPADTGISNVAPDNNIVGNGQGVVNTTARIFDARKNWWGDASGPSGGNIDPFTGRTASGSGDEIAAPGAAPDTNVAFDPFLTASTFQGGAAAGTADECLVQRAGGSGPLIERLRMFRDRHLEGRLGRWLTRQYYRVSSVVVTGDSG